MLTRYNLLTTQFSVAQPWVGNVILPKVNQIPFFFKNKDILFTTHNFTFLINCRDIMFIQKLYNNFIILFFCYHITCYFIFFLFLFSIFSIFLIYKKNNTHKIKFKSFLRLFLSISFIIYLFFPLHWLFFSKTKTSFSAC